MKDVLIFGSSGSIGKSSLNFLSKHEEFRIKGLCVNRDIQTLKKQIDKFRPGYVCVVDEAQAEKLRKVLSPKVKFFKGESGLKEFSAVESDISLMAISGISSLVPLLINIGYTKRVALANKEAIVIAGSLIFSKAKLKNTEIIPVDSEISALFQLFMRKDHKFEKVYLTASGGALRNCPESDLLRITAKEVLAHPNWSMGQRITVDSATLVNKAFEVIETHRFFDIDYNNIDVIIHRESIVHAMVEYRDKTVFSCLYPPNMSIPISYAFFYPSRVMSVKGLSFEKGLKLSFEPVDYARYPLLETIIKTAKKEDNGLAVLNACDEVTVDYFLRDKIKFPEIAGVLKYFSKKYPSAIIKNVEDVFYWDRWAREKTKEYLEKLC